MQAVTEQQQRAAEQIAGMLDNLSPSKREEAERLIEMIVLESDWSAWGKLMFPTYVAGEFSPFHAHASQWFFDIEAYEPIEGLLEIFSRFFAKSTTMQMGAVSCGARKTRQFVLYISETQAQADDHVQTIGGGLISNSRIGDFYPDLASRKVGKHGNAQGWRRNRFWTKSDFIIDAIGLDTAARGVKLEEKRPDLMIFDDVDGKHDSPHITQKKIEIITNNLMPAGSDWCAYAVGQNLIHKDGFVAQLEDLRLKIMKNRRFYGIVPAIRNLEWKRDEEGFGVIVGGEPTWDYMSIPKLQKKMDEIGVEAFLTECQHEVDLPMSGAIFGEWNELYHIITDEEFAEGWETATGEQLQWTTEGRVQLPYNFTIGRFQDVGTTKDHPNVTTYWDRPPEISGFGDSVFSHREVVFPEFWWDDKASFQSFSIGEIAESLYTTEVGAYERHRISDSDCFISHEASSELLAYERDIPEIHRIFWNKWQGDFSKMYGVGIMKNFMRIDFSKPHPFRKYPKGHEKEGQPLQGRPRFYLIAKKGQGELYLDVNNRMRARKAVDAGGHRRARWEIPLYRLPKNSTGEEAKLPKRINDDWVSTAKAAAANMFPQSKSMTKEQRAVKELAEIAPTLTDEAIEARPEEERQGAKMRRDVVLDEIRNRQPKAKPQSRLAVLRELQKRGKR